MAAEMLSTKAPEPFCQSCHVFLPELPCENTTCQRTWYGRLCGWKKKAKKPFWYCVTCLTNFDEDHARPDRDVAAQYLCQTCIEKAEEVYEDALWDVGACDEGVGTGDSVGAGLMTTAKATPRPSSSN